MPMLPLRLLRRRFGWMTALPALWWVWKERHVLAGMAGFARTIPDRMRLGRGSELALAAKVNLALLRDQRLHGADIRLGAVQNGDVCLEAGRGSEAAAEVARRVIERVPGVATVRVEDASAVPARSTGTMRGTESPVSGTVEAPATGEDMPVRV